MIRSHDIHEGRHLIHVREFQGVHDLSDIARQRAAEGQDELGNSSISGQHYFTGTESLDEAVHLAQNGWPKGVRRMAAVAKSIEIDSAVLQSAIKIDSNFDVAGDEPDIGRFLQGEPEDMVTYLPGQQTHGRVLDLVINVTQHARVDKELIENRGAGILAAVEALRSCGYSIGVFAVEQSSPSSYGNDNEIMRYEIPILEPGQSVNVDTLAFSIMHPSFLRRLIFAANEAESDDIRHRFGFKGDGGYGMPLPIGGYRHTRPAHIIDKDEGLTSGHKETIAFAQKIVKESLETLKASNED